jgi:hypothetical protein
LDLDEVEEAKWCKPSKHEDMAARSNNGIVRIENILKAPDTITLPKGALIANQR